LARKEKDYHFIYKTTNIINNKYYIGMHSTNNLEDGYVGSGKRLWYSINKYGKNNFKVEILEFLDNRKLLKEREKELINEKILNEYLCMNLVKGGGGGFTSIEAKKGRKATDNILLEKYGKKFQSIISRNFHNSLTKEGKIIFGNKIKDGQLKAGFNYNTFEGKKHSEKSKSKIGKKNSINQKGEKNSQYGTCWIYNINVKENKKIIINDLNKWLSIGWIKGRKMNF
jgi:hypothetical protein